MNKKFLLEITVNAAIHLKNVSDRLIKIVYPICAGLDVHKKIVVATIASTNNQNVTTYETKSFSTINFDLFRLKDWLIINNCFDVCMESTGKYWIPIFNILEDSIKVILTHPKHVKAIKGKKTDKKDSKWIADLFKHDLVPSSFIPPKDIRALRDICRYRYKLVCNRVSEKNRVQNSMTTSNIGLANVISDPFGKFAREIMNYLIKSPDEINEDLVKNLRRKNMKATSEELYESIKGGNIQSDQLFKLEICYNHIDELTKHIDDIEGELTKMASKFQTNINLACLVPGIQKMSAIWIIAEIGTDMSVFQSSEHLVSWAGLCPTNNESAGKKKSVKISKAGVYIKPLLIQCALNAIRDSSNSYYKHKYENIKRRRGHKKAIIAVARMMLVSIYKMFLTGETFQPYDLETINNTKPKKQILNEVNTLQYLKQLGIDTSSIENQLIQKIIISNAIST